ncbi:response regulator [Parvularcula sp. IMCC14364]|uniref:response regulator n=1 Tax=Parvularcula sp. IMCC14364 TaxID=3067902 RepID=UPI00274212A7|nr:response regulator [Parvularcula sp. IMCC14364]
MPRRILLVEDDPIDLRFVQKYLEADADNDDLIIDTARNGQEALDVLKENHSHCFIILDLNMPGMDGRQLLTALKSDEELKKIPAIVLSTSDSQTDIEECYARHANAYLVKPDSPGGYKQTVLRLKEFWLDEVRLTG